MLKEKSKEIIKNDIAIVREIKNKSKKFREAWQYYTNIEKKESKDNVKKYIESVKEEIVKLVAFIKEYNVPKELDNRTKKLLKGNFDAIRKNILNALIEIRKSSKKGKIPVRVHNLFGYNFNFTDRLIEYLNEVLDHGRIIE